MSNVICNVLCNSLPEGQEFYDLMIMTQRRYAQRINADYLVMHDDKREFRKGGHKSMATFNVYDLIGKYDGILKIDPDMLVMPNAPDVFKMFPDRELHYCLKYDSAPFGSSSSIMLLSKNKSYYDLSVLKSYAKTDEKIQKEMFPITKPKCGTMDWKWNYKVFCGKERVKKLAYVIHYESHKKEFLKARPELIGKPNLWTEIYKHQLEAAQKDYRRYFK